MGKINFRTKYDEKKRSFSSPTGEKTEVRHEPHMRADGRRELLPTKIVPIYELIQAEAEECEIERIVKRAMEGDYNALNAMNGVYADISDAPRSLAEAQQVIMNAKEQFKKLPEKIRKEFEYNPEIYVASVGTKEWFDKMGITAEYERMTEVNKEAKKLKENTAAAMEAIANGAGVVIKNGGATNDQE